MATVYLAPAPTGDDTRTYVQAQNSATPWATVGKCNTDAVTGDTISIAAGTYTWATIAFTKSFTLIGAAFSNGHPVVIFDAGLLASLQWTLSGGFTLTCQNIKFINTANTSNYPFNDVGTAVADTFSFTGCEFMTSRVSTAVYASYFVTVQTGTAFTFSTCVFNNIQRGAGVVNGWIIHPYAGAVTLNNCVFYCTATGADELTQLIYNGSATATLTGKNNIFYRDSANVGLNGGFATTITLTYSDFFGFANPGGTGNITSDPLLIDGANSNFNLRPTSPCLGTGTIV